MNTTNQIVKKFQKDIENIPDGIITKNQAYTNLNTISGKLFVFAEEKYKNDGIPLEALVITKKNKKNPMEAYFQEQSNEAYQIRITKILETLDKIARETFPTIICLQEINPLQEFLITINKFKKFSIINHPNMETDNTNSIITKNWSFKIIPRKICALKNILGKKKSNSQLLEYHISELQSTLFNIHGAYTFMNKDLAQDIYNAIKSYNTNILIIGDFNFTSKNPTNTMERKVFEHKLKEYSFYVGLAPTPEIAFNQDLSEITYDGFIIKKKPIIATMKEIIL